MVLDLIEKDFCSIGDEVGRNVITFGVDMSPSPHIFNKKTDTLILGKDPTQGLEHTLTAENCIQSTLLNTIQNFVLACIIIEQIVIHSSMVQKLLNSKQKILKL